jgi:hypothetical protein
MACKRLAVKPPSLSFAPTDTGTSAILKVLAITLPLLIAEHPLFTVLCLSSSLDKIHNNSYPSPVNKKMGASAMPGNEFKFRKGRLILMWWGKSA